MRNAFVERLSEHADSDRRIFLLTGDLGFGVLDSFSDRFPDQFLNVGVAEQNMTAVAAGLALEGHIAFTYSIGNFPTLRCLEQLRNDVCYHNANVKIVSVGGGFSYGQLGMSHHATEDLSILRALPGMVVCAPCSRWETRMAVDAVILHDGPSYLRLERAGEFDDDASVPFDLGRARLLRDGTDLTLVGVGGIVSELILAADSLRDEGLSCRVLSLHTLKPLDTEALLAAAEDTGGIVTVEENTILGGLGGAVAEVCLEHGVRPKRFRRLGVRDYYMSIVGDQQFLRAHAQIDCAAIIEAVRSIMKG